MVAGDLPVINGYYSSLQFIDDFRVVRRQQYRRSVLVNLFKQSNDFPAVLWVDGPSGAMRPVAAMRIVSANLKTSEIYAVSMMSFAGAVS